MEKSTFEFAGAFFCLRVMARTSVVICPGTIETAMGKYPFEQRRLEKGVPREEYFDRVSSAILLERFGKPEKLVRLFDDRTTYINRDSIIITGGKVMV